MYTVLIPAYKPTECLLTLVDDLVNDYTVVVVDDGSGCEYDRIFTKLPDSIHVVRYEKNGGKGAALKTGYKYIRDNIKTEGVITADADGQHLPCDISKLADHLSKHGGFVIGARRFEGKVPFKSRAGNNITKAMFCLLYHTYVSDTQTGLRGFDISLIDFMKSIEGERYEYEMNVLTRCAKARIRIAEVGITTVYENDNKGSHFNPFKDSLRIYSQLLKYSLFSLLSFLIDYVLLLVFSKVFASFISIEFSLFTWKTALSLLIATVLARIISSLFNYTMNKIVVFGDKKKSSSSLPKYALLALFSLILSYFLLSLSHDLLGIPLALAKPIVDILVFFLNFIIQKKLIFKE